MDTTAVNESFKEVVNDFTAGKGAQQTVENGPQHVSYLYGFRLHAATIALSLALFLAGLESTIISTSLISITNDLGGFQQSSWIVAAYFLGYTSSLIILAKLSDIFGRKLTLACILINFTAFSLACGLAQSIPMLITFRVFQGVGGGGINAMVFTILPEMVPMSKFAQYGAWLAAVGAISMLTGPLLGGLINIHTTWRWVFLLNPPVATIVLVIILLTIPPNFPHQHQKQKSFLGRFSLTNLKRIDFLGGFILTGATGLVISSLEVGGTKYSWRQAPPLVLLFLSVLFWIALFFLEWYRHDKTWSQEPVFPWRIVTNRFAMAAIIISMFQGAVFLSVVIYIPQKLQIVNGNTPLEAGYRLLALTLASSVGAAVAVFLRETRHIASFYLFLVAGVLQIVPLALLGSISPLSRDLQPGFYGFEVLMGLGLGMSLALPINLVPLVFESRDAAVGMGALPQFRWLGGSIGVTICANIINHQLTSRLQSILPREQLSELSRSTQVLKNLPPVAVELVRQAYAIGFQRSILVLNSFAGAAMLATFLLWGKPSAGATKVVF